jgi:hypothetical protein
MAITFNIFRSGLDGGTVVLTGDVALPATLSGTFRGFRVVNNCFISSILNQDGDETLSNVILNGNVEDITDKQLVLGDVVSPENPSTSFTEITIQQFSNRSQIVIYKL